MSEEDLPGKTSADEIKEKFESIVDESNGEGQLGVKVFDEDGNEKENVQCLRVEGEGSVEVRKFDAASGTDVSTQPVDEKWAVRRRDKLEQNKEDKLGNNK